MNSQLPLRYRISPLMSSGLICVRKAFVDEPIFGRRAYRRRAFLRCTQLFSEKKIKYVLLKMGKELCHA